MQQLHPIRKTLSHFFPRRSASLSIEPEDLSLEQKKELVDVLLAQGGIALLNNEFSAACSYFWSAAHLAPNDPKVWIMAGLAFFDHGRCLKRQKSVLLASRHFKQATTLSSEIPEIWALWGSSLLELGISSNEHHYLLEAKEKFQKAFADGLTGSAFSWEYGLLWIELSKYSGEALDIRLAIQAFRNCSITSHKFFYDFGYAYLQMGLLTNDARHYQQAIDSLQKALLLYPDYIDAQASLAEAYSQLYLNTADERIALKGLDCYAWLVDKSPKDAEAWLGWAQLLGESGRLNRDPKKLQQAIEKCAEGSRLDPENPLLIAQWVEALSLLGALTNRLDLLIEGEQKILDATDRFPNDPDLWHSYGICLISFGHYYSDPDYYDLAIEKLQIGISIDRTHAELWHALGLAHMHYAHLMEDPELVERSTRFYSFALDLKPACPALLFDAANAWLLSCDLHDDFKDLQYAIELYELLLQHQKDALLNHPEWLFQYATALEWLSDFTADEEQLVRAIDLFLHVLLIDPESPNIHFRIATCFVRLGENSCETEYFLRAEHHFRFAARQDDEDSNVWLEWGMGCISLAYHSIDPAVQQQAYHDAEQKILRAGQLGNLLAYYNLACLYSLRGQCEMAMDLLRKAQKASALPDIDELIENEWLENLQRTEMFAQFLSSLETKGL